MSKESNYYTTKDVGKILGVAQSTVRKYIHNGVLPPSIHPTRYRVEKTVFDKWYSEYKEKVDKKKNLQKNVNPMYYDMQEISVKYNISMDILNKLQTENLLPTSKSSNKYLINKIHFDTWYELEGEEIINQLKATIRE